MKIKYLPLDWFVNQLKNSQPFTFARYGDGEWLTILGFYGMHNSNGCTFTKELSDDMRVALKRHNPYHHAILKIARRERKVPFRGDWVPYGGPVIEKWLADGWPPEVLYGSRQPWDCDHVIPVVDLFEIRLG